MSKPTPFPDLQAAREQAALWIARQDRGLDDAEHAEFIAWRGQPANDRALRELGALWQDMDRLQVLAREAPEPRLGRHRARRNAIAACAALLLGIALTLPWTLRPHRPATQPASSARSDTYVTAVGEHREVKLADGSLVALNTNTQLQVSLQEKVRSVRLLRGEAHFSVAHDVTRPFRVTAEGRVVQAVGTAFDVRVQGDHALEVMVTEGRVSVDDAPAGPPDQVRPGAMPLVSVSAGEALSIDAGGRNALRELDALQLESAMAWRSGHLVFNGETLQQVLDEFSRYTPDRFVIPDTGLRKLRIGGYFPTGDTRALRATLASGFGILMTPQPDGALRVELAHAPEHAAPR